MESTRRKSNRLDLTGQKYGALTVLAPSKNIGGRTTWQCLCDCGNTRIVKTREIRRGKATNCGCSKRPSGLQQMHYISGTCLEMLRSTKIRSNNTSGHPGVFREAHSNKWRAEIMFQGKRYFLGRFASIKEAIASREQAKEKLHNHFVREFGNDFEIASEGLKANTPECSMICETEP